MAYTIATDDGLVMYPEANYETREEAEAYLEANPLTPRGTPQIIVTGEQAHALDNMRVELNAALARAHRTIAREWTSDIVRGV